MFATLVACLLAVAVLGAAETPPNPIGPTAINASRATGGPVPPATTRDNILVALMMTAAIAVTLIGLFLMKN